MGHFKAVSYGCCISNQHPDQADGLQGQGMGLRNFDLSEYQQVLSDLAIWIYQTLLELMQDLVQHTVGELSSRVSFFCM